MKPLSPSYWRRLVTKEWLPIIISLILSAVLWYNVGGEKTVDTSVMIPVEVLNLPRDLVISNQFKRQLEVTVHGPRSLILGIDQKQISRRIDLANATPGTSVISNDVESITVPRGITVLRVQPATIILSLDKLISKQFPINPVTVGNPLPGYVLEGLRMEPNVITITGPESVLVKHEVLRTREIDLNNINKSLQVQVPLDLDPAIVDLIGETTITADIAVKLEKEQYEYTLPLDAEGLEVPVKRVKVIADVPKLLLNQGIKLTDMLTARLAIDEVNGIGIVRIIQAPDLSHPVEIIQVEPAVVEVPKNLLPKPETRPPDGEPKPAAPPAPDASTTPPGNPTPSENP
jgi:YbbR domain-containing protein